MKFVFDLSFLACPACRFNADAPVTVAANMAIGVMFIFLVCVLAGFLALIRHLARGEREATKATRNS